MTPWAIRPLGRILFTAHCSVIVEESARPPLPCVIRFFTRLPEVFTGPDGVSITAGGRFLTDATMNDGDRAPGLDFPGDLSSGVSFDASVLDVDDAGRSELLRHLVDHFSGESHSVEFLRVRTTLQRVCAFLSHCPRPATLRARPQWWGFFVCGLCCRSW